MSYKAAQGAMSDYRKDQIATLLGETPSGWFMSKWDSVGDMLAVFGTDGENAAIAGKYAGSPGVKRAADHMRLDYVCALRREIRKQYVSGDGDICTDVTPFRHGVMSAHGAEIFDGLLDTVMSHAERQAKGG